MGDSLEPFVPRPRTPGVPMGGAYSPSISMGGNLTQANQSEIDRAIKTAREGFGAALLVAIVTGICAQFEFAGVGKGAFLDAFIFGAAAFGIYNMSRVAAVAGLLFFAGEKIYMWSTQGFSNPIMALILAGAFLNGIRGTFKYHSLKR